MEEIILDMDPGVDDALAIILALESQEFDVLGITTVSGNVDVDKTTRNALRILNFMDRLDIPVYKGAYKPMINSIQAVEEIHGSDGLGDVDIPDPPKKEEEVNAVNYLINMVREKPKEITVVATGPLTNIALAILMDQDFVKNVKGIISMGGAFNITLYGYGNYTSVSEFNVYTDPEAAKIVYESGADIYVIGLDITTRPDTVLTREEREKIRDDGGRVGKLFYSMSEQSFKYLDSFALHDPLSLSPLIDDELISFEKFRVDVELCGLYTRGQTIVDRRDWLPDFLREKPNINVAVDIDGEKFLKLMWDRVFSK